MNLIFWGTPQTAVPFLKFLRQENSVAAVITRPDESSGRGLKIHPSPVKIFSESNHISVLQPDKLKDPAFIQTLKSLNPEMGIVVAYGKLIPRSIIDLFPKGLFNVHFSILPRLRGAAPMQRAILEGETQTGVTIFQITEELDAGAVLVQKPIGIAEGEDAETLEQKLIPLGIEALKEALERVQNGSAALSPQKGSPTFAPLLTKEDAKINWNKSALEIARQARAFIRMGAFCRLPNGKLLKILQCGPLPSEPTGSNIGAITGFERHRGFIVRCGEGRLLVLRVQLEGKKASDAWSFLQGARLKENDLLIDASND